LRILKWTEKKEDIVKEALSVLKKGGVLIIPTETLYALSTDATQQAAVDKIFGIKKREKQKAFSVFVPSYDWIPKIAYLCPLAQKVAENFLPGPVTLILKAKISFPKGIIKDEKIGIRISSHEVPTLLAEKLKKPITATSANISGLKDAHEIDEIPEDVIKKVDIVIDAGRLMGIPSTVVDFTSHPPKIIREGAIKKDDLKKLWGI